MEEYSSKLFSTASVLAFAVLQGDDSLTENQWTLDMATSGILFPSRDQEWDMHRFLQLQHRWLWQNSQEFPWIPWHWCNSPQNRPFGVTSWGLVQTLSQYREELGSDAPRYSRICQSPCDMQPYSSKVSSLTFNKIHTHHSLLLSWQPKVLTVTWLSCR